MIDEEKLHTLFDKITDKDSFVSFIKALSKNSRECKSEWENLDVDVFLEAFAAYCEDVSIVELSWKEFGRLFMGAKTYE